MLANMDADLYFFFEVSLMLYVAILWPSVRKSSAIIWAEDLVDSAAGLL